MFVAGFGLAGILYGPPRFLGVGGTPGAFGVMQSSVSIVTDPGADFVS